MDTGSNCGSTGQLSSADSTGVSMHHSHSTPAGVDGGARTPPATPKKGGKMLAIRVQMLDDTITIFQVQAKALGSVLFEQVCKQLHLLEADYFGLEYADMGGTRYWLDLQKPISRQLGLSLVDPLLYFCVKFYTPDPGQLEEEYTRYLFCLQIKRDLAQGMMQCNENTAALMASYIVQAECGDYVAEDYPDHTYLSSYKFVPQQDHEMERKIMENHKKHAGQSPAEADLNLLETARRCELYGMKMHPAKDHENVPLNLAVAHMGILVFQNYTKINTFSWAKIRKISFKRKRFLIKLHPEGYGYYKDTVEFFFEGRNECKNFWKKCVENHGFFRCSSVKHVSRHKTRVLSRGSSFRYSGKTQKQIVEFVRDNYVKRQAFQRSASFRHSSAHSSASNMHATTVGNSISAHPLLPLADTNFSVEVSKLSASLGSMGAAVGAPASPTTRSACRPRGRATCWSSAPDTLPTTLPARTTTSPSPPQTTQSLTPPTSATSSPPRTRPYDDPKRPYANSSLPGVHHAVHAAVHRADTGTTRTTSIRTPSNHKSEGALDLSPPTRVPFTNHYPSQTQSQNDLGLRTAVGGQAEAQASPEYTYKSMTTLPKRQIWQRSASCRDLYDFSFEDSGEAKRRPKLINTVDRTNVSMEERKLESPITRYDDHRVIYSSTSRDNSLEIHQDIMMPDQKVYSSSYPGTTSYSQESMEDPGNYDLRDSQDDLSHDSYELIERSDDEYTSSGDYKHQKTKPLNLRSCSLDSGNYLPSDTDSDIEKRHKCKSSSDVHQDLFSIDDPRDFPREIIPRKSDGSFYKAFKSSSRTSSLESKSDYYDTKTSKSSRESLKKRGVGSRTSSQESRSDTDAGRPTHKNKSAENLSRKTEYVDSRASSFESKSEYYDTTSKMIAEDKYITSATYRHEFDRRISFERNYGTQKPKHDTYFPEISRNHADYNGFPGMKETTHVHSISLQNVETEQSIRSGRKGTNLEQNTVPRTQKSSHQPYKQSSIEKTTHIWPQSIPGLPTEIPDWTKSVAEKRSTESESNIFSFDEDKIQSLQESSDLDTSFSVVPNIDKNLLEKKKDTYKTKFMEIETRSREPLPLHQPIERTKSDPNSLARQRINCGTRRLLLMHQKSIDLTPAESSDEDYLYKQIPPSAPPIMKYRGSHFEMPTAEFGHFDILKREIEGQKTKFEVPKSQFEVLGAKTQSDFVNLPPKSEEITYVLHKRHVMNGTAAVEKPKPIESEEKSELITTATEAAKPVVLTTKDSDSQFLFTQNIDLSKVDPVTLEVDKTAPPVQLISSPKRDITHMDPVMLEALSSKLSQIESDSPTSSKTESIQPKTLVASLQKEKLPKVEVKVKVNQNVQTTEIEEKPKLDPKLKPKEKPKTEMKVKRIIKPRMQPGKKGAKTNKTKVRITSFSSDDESLDSDDVFGSAEATPTRVEFSPPQTRKEMESILKFESERKYLQYTMSSTEVEGSPPTTRKKTDKKHDHDLDVNVQPELRRISERSFSIPSSEDDLNIKTCDMQPVFGEIKNDDKSLSDTLKEDTIIKLKDIPPIQEERDFDKEREMEKMLLQAEIENDIRDLRVPSRTKLTELSSPSFKKKGQLFAHARLNLSEGSAFTLLQKQQTSESPISGRRAISLDTPIIAVTRLPPLNALSSKDDTVEETDTDVNKYAITSEPSEESISEKTKPEDLETCKEMFKAEVKVKEVTDEAPKEVTTMVLKEPVVEKLPEKPKVETPIVKDIKPELKPKKSVDKGDQIVPDVSAKMKKSKSGVQTKSHTQKTSKHRPTHLQRSKDSKSTTKEKVIATKTKTITKPPMPSPISVETTPVAEKVSETEVSTTEKEKAFDSKVASLKESQASLSVPEIKRTKSQEIESTKHVLPKEKTRSLDKLEFKRMGSKERTKSQEESDSDIALRREKQQMLYETAIKQTKTIKSPVKDVLPVFPQVEEMVRERGGKLEISINTIENTSIPLEEAIIITKSPKKLDKKIDKKLTKSLELNLSVDDDNKIYRLGKSLDLDNRPSTQTEEHIEFDFKQDAIKDYHTKMEKSSQENEDEADEEEADDDEETTEIEEPKEGDEKDRVLSSSKDAAGSQDNIVLEGTSLDVWLSVSERKPDTETTPKNKLEDIKVIHKSDSFFDQRIAKPPDLGKTDTKSSSDSQSTEKVSLGNSLDIKYIDDSGDSSHKSDQDAQLIAQMQKASDTVSKFLRRKLTSRQKAQDLVNVMPDNIIRITSEDESLVEISDLKCEDTSGNLLSVEKDPRKTLSKTSIDRSRSEETASWMTVECDEYIGVDESFESDNPAVESPEKVSAYDDDEKTLQAACEIKSELKLEPRKSDESLTIKETKPTKLDLLKCSDQSKSSDTTGSWTSGEKEISPGNVKETDESSASCSMGRAIGLSQTIEIIGSRDINDRSPSESEPPRSPRSPRSPRICVLGRAFTIDEGSGSQRLEGKEGFSELSSDEAQDIPRDAEGKELPQANRKTLISDEKQEESKPAHKKVSRAGGSYGDKGSFSSIDDSIIEKRKNGRMSGDKPSLCSIEKLSTDSRNSLDTESSSGSLGIALRVQKPGDIPKELSSTWKPFPLDSSGSESFDDGLLPPDQDYVAIDSNIEPGGSRDDTELPEDLANFSSNFAYTSVLSDIGGLTINLSTADVIPGYGATYLSRTLSRISERSTNSEKSSLDEDITKASTQSDSLNDESLASSNPQISLSSDPPSNAHVSDNGRKSPPNGASITHTKNGKFSESSSGKQAKISDSSSSKRENNHKPSLEQIPNINNLLQRQISDDRRTSAEMAELSMDDIEIITSERGLKLKRQGSDDTIIDEECFESEYKEEKKGSSSQESDEWPLPDIPQQSHKQLLAMHEVPSSDTSQQTTQVFQPPRNNIPKVFGLRGSLKSQDSEQWPSPPSSVAEPPLTGNVETYYMTPPEIAQRETVDSNTTNSNDNSYSDSENKTLELDTEKTHTYENVATEHRSDSISESLSVGVSGVKIVLDTKSLYVRESNSEDEDLNLSNLNDDVFTDTVDSTKNELRPPTVLRRSTTSDDSSHSGKKSELKPPRKASHSSHSDEEGTSSMTTHFEDGTVRYALKPTKCTHSSHSEDTSMALSLSEWSNSTNTVKFQNLSSNSGTTKSSSGLKSEDNSLTDIALSEWSSSNSNTMKAQQSSSLQFQKLSSTTSTGDSTLTEMMPTISEWSSSDSKTLVAQPLFPSGSLSELQPVCRLGSSVDEGELDLKNIPSPKNIPSEDLALLSTSAPPKVETKSFTKSTERPIVIPVQTQSDTEKSSSSVEHKTVHTQRYDKDKQKYLQKHHTSPSTERPVKVPLKFSKCSPYYSSSLSSESTPLASTSPVPMSKTATVPLTRTHRKPVSKCLFQAKSPPSENDSTSSVESPKSKSDRDRRGYRRKRQSQTQKKQRIEKEQQVAVDEYFYVESETGLTEYSEYLHHKNLEGLASSFQYESSIGEGDGMHYIETLEEGYYPDQDSQSGSDIFRMEKDDDDRYETADTFDVSSIPPPLLEDELEDDTLQP